MRLLEHNIRIVLDGYHNTRTRNSFTVQNVPIVVLDEYFSKPYCNISIPFSLIVFFKYEVQRKYLSDNKIDFIEYFEFGKLYKNVD